MDKIKIAFAGGAAVLVILGGLVYSKFDSWFSDEPTGPGSGDVVEEPTGPSSGDEMPSGPEPVGPGSGDEINSEYFKGVAKGSCNIIARGSTCAEYIGDYYTNKDFKELNCDSVGAYTEGPCPRPVAGGCRMNAGNVYEMVVWHYDYGGDPFDAEELGYAAQGCNMSPMGEWIHEN